MYQNTVGRLFELPAPAFSLCSPQDAPVPKGGEKLVWTPSKLVERLGREIDNEESVWYWAAKHGIPVFCPGITDGAVRSFHCSAPCYPVPPPRPRLLPLVRSATCSTFTCGSAPTSSSTSRATCGASMTCP